MRLVSPEEAVSSLPRWADGLRPRWGSHPGGFWAMGPGDWLWMILVIAACVAILVALVWAVASGRWGRPSATSEDAAHILKARFARGDISPEDYEQARRLLGVS